MTTFQLNVNITSEDLDIFQDGKWKLYLTKGVKPSDAPKPEPGNVVYSEVPNKKLSQQISFTWSEDYQIFMTEDFNAGVNVDVRTPKYGLTPGHQADIDTKGNATIKGGTDQNALEVVNHWKGGGRVGVMNFDKKSGQYTAIYVSKSTNLNMTRKLTPVQYMGLFFEEQWATDTMLDLGKTDIYYIDLTNHKGATVSYAAGSWKLDQYH